MSHFADLIASRRTRLVLATVLVVVVAAIAARAAADADDGYRHERLADRSGQGLSLTQLWLDMAEAAECESKTTLLEEMRLEYSRSGRLQQAWIVAVSVEGARLELFLSGKYTPDEDVVQTAVGVYDLRPVRSSRAVTLGEPLFRAIDLVGPAAMIAAMPDVGYGSYYTFHSAYSTTSPLQPISPSASAFVWDGSRFVALAPTDDRREYVPGYEYVAGSCATLVSTSSSDNIVATAHRGSYPPVFFLISTPHGPLSSP